VSINENIIKNKKTSQENAMKIALTANSKIAFYDIFFSSIIVDFFTNTISIIKIINVNIIINLMIIEKRKEGGI